MEYDVFEENIALLKNSLNKAANKFIIKYYKGCDAMFEDVADYYKREFEIYLDTLNARHQKQPEEKKVPENDGKGINATSEFEF